MPPAIPDLQRAFDTLKAKSQHYATLWRYYDGDQPLVYAADRLREVFRGEQSRFSENWCAVVVDSEHERIQLKEFTLAAPVSAVPVAIPAAANGVPAASVVPPAEPPVNPLAETLNDVFAETELNLDADDVHKAALVCGEAYVIVWKDADVGIEAYYHDPGMCHVFYDPEHPRRKQFAAKWWVGEDDGRRYLNLYYPDRIEYYVSTQKVGSFSTWKGMKPADMPSEEHDFGEVPVFHFRTDRRKITSRLQNVLEPQNAINKLLADMMVAAEFGAFKQRWIVSNADITTLKNSPNEIWNIPAGDGSDEGTQVGEFSAMELGNYLGAMDKLATTIGVITRTPKHYFFGQGGDPSGEALIAMEAPLNKKAQKAIDVFKPTWAEVAAFLLKLNGNGDVNPRDITPVFARPETVQPRTQAEIRQMDVATGIPLVTALKREGWTDAEIAAMQKDKAEAQQQAAPQVQFTDDDTNAVNDTLRRLGIADMLDDDDGADNDT